MSPILSVSYTHLDVYKRQALIHQPQLVLADEPTGNLDQYSAYEMVETLYFYCREEKASVIVSTHNDRLLKSFSGRILQLDQGHFCLLYTSFAPPLIASVLFSVSVAIAIALLYSYFLPGKWIILILSLFVLLGALFQDQMLSLRIIGVLAGIAYPSLAVFSLIDGLRSKKNPLVSILVAFCMVFAGGLVVSCGLYHWLYVLRIEQYSGVKTSLVIPILLVVLYLFRSGYLKDVYKRQEMKNL